MKEIILTYDETTLLENIINYYYTKYATPPFKDVEDRFSVTLDASHDIVKDAERQEERIESQQKNDLLSELGAKDDPTSPDYISQLKRAEFYASRALVRRWYNGLQFSLLNRLRYEGDHENAVKAYIMRNDRAGFTITYESLKVDEKNNRIFFEPSAIDDLRSIVHYICAFMNEMNPRTLQTWLEHESQLMKGFEDKVSTSDSISFQQEAQELNNRFTQAYEPLIIKLLSLYRMSKYKTLA